MFLSAADDLSEDDADDVQGAGVVMPMAMLSGNGVAEKSLGRVPGADSVPQARQYNERLARARAEPEQEERDGGVGDGDGEHRRRRADDVLRPAARRRR